MVKKQLDYKCSSISLFHEEENHIIWFKLNDICSILGKKNTTQISYKIEDCDKKKFRINGKRESWHVNINGLRRLLLILRTSTSLELLNYIDREFQIQNNSEREGNREILSDSIKEEEVYINDIEISKEVKEDFYDKVTSSKGFVSLDECAQLLGYGKIILFRLLKHLKILSSLNLPYQRFVNMGYFRLELEVIDERIVVSKLVSPKGIQYIHKRLKKYFLGK